MGWLLLTTRSIEACGVIQLPIEKSASYIDSLGRGKAPRAWGLMTWPSSVLAGRFLSCVYFEVSQIKGHIRVGRLQRGEGLSWWRAWGACQRPYWRRWRPLAGEQKGWGSKVKAMSQAFHLQGGCHGVKIVGVAPEDRTGTSSSRGCVVVTSCVLGMSGGQKVSPEKRGQSQIRVENVHMLYQHRSWWFKGILTFRHIDICLIYYMGQI